MKHPLLGILLILLWALPLALWGQSGNLQFYTTEDGLSNDRIWEIGQDDLGFIWVNSDGFNRFDGHRFLNHSNRNTTLLEQINFSSSVIGKANIFYLDTKELVRIHINTEVRDSFSISPYLPKGAPMLWNRVQLSSNGDVVIALLNEEKRITKFLRMENDVISLVTNLEDYDATFEANDLHYQVDSKGNIYYLQRGANHFMQIKKEDSKPRILQTNFVHNPLFRLSNNSEELLIAHNGAFYYFDGSGKPPRPHPINQHIPKITDEISTIKEAENGDLWISIKDRQVLHYNTKTNTIIDYSAQIQDIIPNSLQFSSIFEDKTGSLWLGSQLGLLRIVPNKLPFEMTLASSQEWCDGACSFRGITEDEHGRIYASFYSGIIEIDPTNRNALKPPLVSNITPYGLDYTDGHLLLNRGNVLNLNDHSLRSLFFSQLEPIDEGVFTQTNQGEKWFARKNTLYVLNTQHANWKWDVVHTFQDEEIQIMKYDDHSNLIWLHTNTCTRVFNPSTRSFEFDKFCRIDSKVSTRDILPIKDRRAWLATQSGLHLFNLGQGIEKSYTTKDGLSHNYIYTILSEGDSCLWLGTEHGLSRFDIAAERFTNFYEEDGIANNEFNRASAYKAKNGQFFFGGISGITSFFPEDIMEAYNKTNQLGQLNLTQIVKADSRVKKNITETFFDTVSTIDIYHHNKSFQLEYALSQYASPERVKYSYQLEGYNNIWTEPDNSRVATFNAIPIGKYRLRVKALTNRGEWHHNELSVEVIVHPPWWKTWWAYLTYGLLFVGLMFGIGYFLRRRWIIKNQLVDQQRESERLMELDQFKSNLYTNLTHEFRTPLTVILGMADRLKDSLGKEKGIALKQNESIKLIEKNGLGLLRLVNQLLDLSKLESNAFKLNLQQNDIISYLRYISESFNSFASQKDVDLHFFSSIHSLEMDFDPEQVRHVLTNLISNAIKFTPSGGIIKIEVSSQGKTLGVRVIDSGIGISKENLQHIFDRFYQVDGTRTRVAEGTGIGLAHTKELVHLMSGTIQVESELNKGSIFILKLPIESKAIKGTDSLTSDSGTPIALGQLESDINRNPLEDASETAAINPQKANILIVEDNPDVVYYLKSCLSDAFNLDVAYNGRIGIDKAIENTPDIVVSDVMMPEVDGYELTKTLKEDMRTSHIPIILLTGKADIDSKKMGLRQGADAYLSKPFDKEELLIRLEKMAEKQKRLQDYFKGNELPIENDELKLEHAFVSNVRQIVSEDYQDENFGLEQLCQKAGMSRSQLFRKMKALLSISPSEFIRNYRLEKAKQLLEKGDLNVSEVAWEVGFKQPSHFSRVYQEIYGVTPSDTLK